MFERFCFLTLFRFVRARVLASLCFFTRIHLEPLKQQSILSAGIRTNLQEVHILPRTKFVSLEGGEKKDLLVTQRKKPPGPMPSRGLPLHWQVTYLYFSGALKEVAPVWGAEIGSYLARVDIGRERRIVQHFQSVKNWAEKWANKQIMEQCAAHLTLKHPPAPQCASKSNQLIMNTLWYCFQAYGVKWIGSYR